MIEESVNEEEVVLESDWQPNIFGLGHSREEAEVVLIPAPYDLTCSFRSGTAQGPERLIKTSHQIDAFNPDFEAFHDTGVFCEKIPLSLETINKDFRERSTEYVEAYDAGVDISLDPELLKTQHDINESSKIVNATVYQMAEQCIEDNKIIGLIGGEHSTSLGLIEVLADYIDSFGILQIDAHMDLRPGYQGLDYSHASVMRHALDFKDVSRLIQVGVRDFSEDEYHFAKDQKGRVKTYFDSEIQDQFFQGKTWDSMCRKIVNNCPDSVYISCDIDGLMPSYCPNTGTPVPGGLSYSQVIYLIKQLVKAKKQIIGFDLVEVNGPEQSNDMIVASHLLYQLCGYAWLSQSEDD